jgi:hypothetical protein
MWKSSENGLRASSDRSRSPTAPRIRLDALPRFSMTATSSAPRTRNADSTPWLSGTLIRASARPDSPLNVRCVRSWAEVKSHRP